MNELLGTVHNESCIETMQRLGADSVDLTVTSPPYDDLRTYGGHSDFDFERTAQGLFNITREGGVIVWIVSDQTHEADETGTSFRQALHFKDIGFKLFDTMIFGKAIRPAVGTIKGYWPAFEYMFVLSKKTEPKTINLIRDRLNKTKPDIRLKPRLDARTAGGEYIPTRPKFKTHKTFGRRSNIWQYRMGKYAGNPDAFRHPAIFPERLAADHIRSWSNAGDTVYDPFAGSGTTCLMAAKLGRQWIGSEINPEYAVLANNRIFEAAEADVQKHRD